MKFRRISAIAAARLTTFLLRFFGSGGTSLPGRIALFLCPGLLRELSSDIKILAVTGTNGKTTTSRITGNILKCAGLDFFENKSGANLLPGIAAAFALNCSITGKPRHEYAVIECDEAAFEKAAPQMQPEIVVITNLFRDQLDRYGEISHMLTKLANGLVRCPGSTVILNADDSLSYSLSSKIKNKIITYGLDESPYGPDDNFISDAPYCINCKAPYQYSFRTYGHLGDFSCPDCGYHRTAPDISASDIKMDFKGSSFRLHSKTHEFIARPALPGAYNIYNVLAATAAVSSFIDDPGVLARGISTFESGFGRMETMEIEGMPLSLVLVKNPAGLNQVINFLSFDENKKILVLMLNDKFADGTDISWIWDANFEKLASFSSVISRIFAGGTRCAELVLRLKYAGFDPDEVYSESDNSILLERILEYNKGNLPVYVLPTYTAMFEFRGLLGKKYSLKEFWK